MPTCVRCNTTYRPEHMIEDPIEGWRHADRGLCVTHDRDGAKSNRYFPERQTKLTDAEIAARLDTIFEAPQGGGDNNPSAENKIIEYRRLG